MRDADELDEGAPGLDGRFERLAIECLAGDELAARRDLALGPGPHQRADLVPALQQDGNQVAADIAGAARDEDRAHCGLGASTGARGASTRIRSLRSSSNVAASSAPSLAGRRSAPDSRTPANALASMSKAMK